MRKRTGNIQDRGTSFRIRYTDADGIRHAETFKTRDEADRELAIRLGELAKGLPVSSRPNTVLFGELADDVLTDYEVNGFKSVDDQEARYRLHIIPVFGQKKAATITTAQISRYTLDRLREGAAPGTVNRELELIRHTFIFAFDGRKLLAMPKVRLLKEDNVRTGFFTRDEVARVASFLPEPIASMVRLGFLTGWRYEEIRTLRWSNVDFTRGEIRIDPGRTNSKSGKGRVFPMTAEMRELLAALTPKQTLTKPVKVATMAATAMSWSADFVFSTTTRRRDPDTGTYRTVRGPVGSFKKSWKTACYRAGIPCVVEPVRKGGKRGAVKIISCSRTFHDLRRSFAREMDSRGMRRGAIKKLAGWQTDSVFNRYNIVSDADLRTEVERLDHKADPSKSSTS